MDIHGKKILINLLKMIQLAFKIHNNTHNISFRKQMLKNHLNEVPRKCISGPNQNGDGDGEQLVTVKGKKDILNLV